MSLGRIIVSAETPVPAANPDESMINASDDETVVRVTVGEGMIFAFGEKGEKGDKGDKGDPGSNWGGIGGTLSDQADLQTALDTKADIIHTSASGTVVTITDGTPYPIESLNITIVPNQSGSGAVSPDNIRPISGWAEANIYAEDVYDADADPKLTIPFGQTVYGGTLNVFTGEMTITKGYMTLNGTEQNWSWDEPQTGRYRAWNQDIPDLGYHVNSTYFTSMSNMFPAYTTSSYIFNGGYILRYINNRSRIDINAQAFANLTAFKAFLGEHPMQICWDLKSPTTVQLTPQQAFSLLRGQNVIWNDTGDIAFSYKADTKGYIEKLTKPTEDDMIANANIASGKYFMVGNSLFYSTASIAAGDMIKPGTNCTALSLADALNNLNS